MSTRTNPRRLSQSWQPTFDQDTSKSDSCGKWPSKQHLEPSLHDLVAEHKYDWQLGTNGNKKLFTKAIQHPMGDLVVATPTYTDLKWWHSTGAPDTFSNVMYEAIDDFENSLFNQVKDLVDREFSEQDKDTRDKLIKAICRLTRCVPAGAINANKILDPSGSTKPWIGASDEPFKFEPSPRDDDKSILRVLILGLLERSTDDVNNLSGLFEIENANAKLEQVTPPGIRTFLRSMYHNTIRNDNVYRLIKHFEDVLSGLIEKEPDPPSGAASEDEKAKAKERNFTETTGCESIYVAKSNSTTAVSEHFRQSAKKSNFIQDTAKDPDYIPN